jgi:very-short-patch-repair endonuclease
MENTCLICSKVFKARRAQQKYCSVVCQYVAYRKPKVQKVSTSCSFCSKEFLVLPNKLLTGKGKYCSRTCKDKHQKTLYSGVNNPVYGMNQSKDQKKMTSIRSKKLWESEEYKIKHKQSMLEFVKKHGYYPGTDLESRNKAKITMKKKYGKEHNWHGKFGTRKCDKTTLLKYGKTSAEFLIEYSLHYGKQTDIEKLFEKILEELSIPYQKKFRIYDKTKENFWFREYDFLILDSRILVEVDGDYWHGNQSKFEQLSEFQEKVKINDIVKQKFAEKNRYQVVRFWGSDIKQKYETVKNEFFELWQKLK